MLKSPTRTASLAVLLLACTAALAAGNAPLTVTVTPEPVYIVTGDGCQKVSVDFILANGGEEVLDIESVRLLVFDRQGALVTRREVNGVGMSPSVATLPATQIEPGKAVDIFNPFQNLPAGMELGKLTFVFTVSPRGKSEATSVEATVTPVPFQPKTRLFLPVPGKVFLWEGSDFYAHHRRVNMTHPLVLGLGLKNNISRYGMDFMVLDAKGSTCRGKGETAEDYYVFGKPVLATADGVVADCADGRADNPIGKTDIDYEALMRTRDLKLLGGNRIVVDHGNGEFSVFFHLKNGSQKVRPGDRVKAGQHIADVGNSGDSYEPHLHYQLQTTAVGDCQTLPAVFCDYTRWFGSRSVHVAAGAVDTGDMLERK